MSLKAKIEAVIYASEEPVTLVQLAGLLGHEAQAELDHLDSTQQALALEESPPTKTSSTARFCQRPPKPRRRPSTPKLSDVICTTPLQKRLPIPGLFVCALLPPLPP